MNYGFIITGGDPRTVADLARETEAADWDGICIGAFDTYDPWVVMAAMSTQRVRIGAILTPPARRRPWKLAREMMTLDHLSGGRLVLPVGLGTLDDGGFSKVGEPLDKRVRTRRLDESLKILTGLRNGEPFAYEGEHYRLEEMIFLPKPVQSPRPPIWVVGAWPSRRSMDRAMNAYVTENRAADAPFDIVSEGVTPDDDPERADSIVRPFSEAGITWWIESRWMPPNDPEDLRVRIRQ